jgi:RNA polymerase sigma-70 factor (sigma-E family)
MRNVDAVAVGRSNDRMLEMYSANAAEAYRLAYLLTGDEQVAADIVQDSFVRLFGRFRELANPAAFPWYLRRTVVNLSRDRFRRLYAERKRDRRERSVRQEAAVNLPDVEQRAALVQALRALPHRQRAALVLRYYEDLSEYQTAEVLGCSVSAVKGLVSRGVDRLRERLGGETWD